MNSHVRNSCRTQFWFARYVNLLFVGLLLSVLMFGVQVAKAQSLPTSYDGAVNELTKILGKDAADKAVAFATNFAENLHSNEKLQAAFVSDAKVLLAIVNRSGDPSTQLEKMLRTYPELSKLASVLQQNTGEKITGGGIQSRLSCTLNGEPIKCWKLALIVVIIIIIIL